MRVTDGVTEGNTSCCRIACARVSACSAVKPAQFRVACRSPNFEMSSPSLTVALGSARLGLPTVDGIKQLHEQLCSVHWTGAQLERARLGEHSPSVPGACGNAGQLCTFARRPPPLPLHRTSDALPPSACARLLLRVEAESSCSLAGAIANRLTDDSQTAADPQRGSGDSRGLTDC